MAEPALPYGPRHSWEARSTSSDQAMPQGHSLYYWPQPTTNLCPAATMGQLHLAGRSARNAPVLHQLPRSGVSYGGPGVILDSPEITPRVKAGYLPVSYVPCGIPTAAVGSASTTPRIMTGHVATRSCEPPPVQGIYVHAALTPRALPIRSSPPKIIPFRFGGGQPGQSSPSAPQAGTSFATKPLAAAHMPSPRIASSMTNSVLAAPVELAPIQQGLDSVERGACSCWRRRAARRRLDCRSMEASYDFLLQEAREEVPRATFLQIKGDVPRTFTALPQTLRPAGESLNRAKKALEGILVAMEWLHGNASSTDIGTTYTQGMNFIAAMCIIGFIDDEDCEESAFWLYESIIVELLGKHFFAEWPPLLGYHTCAASLLFLAGALCPNLASALGEEFEDFILMLSCKVIVPCFVGILPAGPLVSLWLQLFESDSSFPQRPLYVCFLAILKRAEHQLLAALSDLTRDEPKSPIVFPLTLEIALTLPHDWRPSAEPDLGDVCPSGPELLRIAQAEKTKYIESAEKRQLMRSCGIQSAQLVTLQREFRQLPSEGSGISVTTLRGVLRRAGLYTASDSSVENLFHLLDRDGSGTLDFFELMTGLVVLSDGQKDNKLRLLFELYDTDGSGYLGGDELLCLAKSLAKIAGCGLDGEPADGESELYAFANAMASKSNLSVPKERCLQHAWVSAEERAIAERFRQRLLLLDENRDGCLSWDEFRGGVNHDPVFIQILSHSSIYLENTKPRSMPQHIAPKRKRLFCC